VSDRSIYDEQAELAVLGCFVNDDSLRLTHINSLRREDFFVTAHKELFDDICKLHDRGEPVTLDRLTPDKNSERMGLLADAMAQAMVPKFSVYLGLVKRESLRRQSVVDAQELIRVAVEEPEKFTGDAANIRGVSIGDIACDVRDDPDELLKRRFLCRGGGAMLNGPTGIGKSSFIMQAAVLPGH
jgi:hypothetical protein